MQDFGSILYNLNKNANREDYLFRRLYRYLYNPDLYHYVFDELKRHNPDLQSRELDDSILETLIAQLKDESYKPLRIKKSGKIEEDELERLKEIPRLYHRLLIEVVRKILEAIFVPQIPEHAYGFKDDESPHLPILEVVNTCKEADYFLSFDLNEELQSLKREILEKALREKIEDERFIRLINKYVKRGYLNDLSFNKTYSSSPVTGRLSSALLKIYLLQIDKELSDLDRQYSNTSPRYVNREYLLVEKELSKAKTEEEKNYLESKLIRTPYYLYSTKAKNIYYTRYANSILVAITGDEGFAESIKRRVVIILNRLLKSEIQGKLTPSNKKTVFLGYQFKVCKRKADRRYPKSYSMPYIELRIPHGRIERLILDKKMVVDIDAKKWKPLHRGSLLNLNDIEIISIYDSELRSFYNYYSLAENVSRKLGQLHYVMEYSCLKTFANKYRTTLLKFKKSHLYGNDWGIEYPKSGGKRIKRIYKGFKRRFKPIKDSRVDLIETNNRIWKDYRYKHKRD